MKILYTLNSESPGGMELHVRDLVVEMSKRGHEIHVWCKEGALTQIYKDAGAKEVVNISIDIDIDPGYIMALSKYLKANSIEIIHAHELKAVINSLIAGKIAKTPVKVSHTHTPISEWKISQYLKFIDQKVNTFFVNTLSTKEIALTESRKMAKIDEGIKETKLEIVPNGINTSQFDISPQKKVQYSHDVKQRYEIPQDRFIFGVVGRISQEKGTEILVEAFSNFLNKYGHHEESFHLFIGGGGPLEDQIKQKAKELGISNITVTGKFDEEDKIKFYSVCDIFVFPTLAEGFGLVLVEAMTVKLPVICSDLEVLSEVAGSTVRYFEKGNAEDLSEKMQNMFLKMDQIQNLTDSAYERVQKLYTLERFGKNYQDLYFKLLEQNR